MYNSEFVRKKKRRKVVAVITGISGMTVAVLVIVSFLGKYVGTFTIKLESGSIKLALQEYAGSTINPDDPQHEEDQYSEISTYLRVNTLPTMHEYTYGLLMNYYGDDKLDTGKTPWYYGANPNERGLDLEDYSQFLITAPEEEAIASIGSINFFKFTFFVTNLGSAVANYKVSLKITDSRPSDDGRLLEDTLRIMLYENYVNFDESSKSEHNKKVFAKPNRNNSHKDEDGNVSYKEAIAYTNPKADGTREPLFGYADEFESDSIITSYNVENFIGFGIMRYTIVYWLEGTDPSSRMDQEPPQNALVKLGVEIDAYEDKKDNE